VPAFSQHSDASLAVRPPDLVAPGVGIVAPSVPGSTLAGKYPAALVGSGKFLRGSGTSQAAAVVSGAAALLWQKWPTLSPIQVRAMLVASANDLGGLSWAYEGGGELDLRAAADAQPSVTPSQADAMLALPEYTSTGAGTLQGARGSQTVTIDGVPLTGEKDIFGNPWNSTTMAAARTAGATWSGGTYNGATWSGATWSSATWSGATWSGATWSGATWSSATWSGATWSGSTWSGADWS
jgi:serine protease AprX